MHVTFLASLYICRRNGNVYSIIGTSIGKGYTRWECRSHRVLKEKEATNHELDHRQEDILSISAKWANPLDFWRKDGNLFTAQEVGKDLFMAMHQGNACTNTHMSVLVPVAGQPWFLYSQRVLYALRQTSFHITRMPAPYLPYVE